MAAPSSAFPSPTLLLHPLSSSTTRPPAVDLTNTWILEFILRQPIPDSLAHEIFLSLPFSSSDLHPHLRKTLLLRRISSDLHRRSLSERTLHSLELIAELDHHLGSTPSHCLKAALCAAERIWMPEAAGGLVSERGKGMERCISSGEGGEEILKRDVEDATRLVRDYLEEALEEMGPPFLEIVAAEFAEKRVDLDSVAGKAGKGATEMNGCFEKLDENNGDAVSMGSMEEDDTSRKDLGVGGVKEDSDGLGEASTRQEDNERGVNVGGHVMPDHSGCKIHQFDPDEVSKVKDALKKSCFDLKMAVEDPLPEAQAVAAAVLDSISRHHELLNETAKQSSVENPVLPVSPVQQVAGVSTGVDTSTAELEKEKWNSSDLNQMEGNRIVKACNKDAGPSKRSDVVASHSFFERNPTAHTTEWSDDSMESSVPMEKLQSLDPMSRRNSPRLDKGKLVKRRPVKRWTPKEEHAFREAVAKYGKGNWKLILNSHSEIFEERTEVDLKDKWRNMARH